MSCIRECCERKGVAVIEAAIKNLVCAELCTPNNYYGIIAIYGTWVRDVLYEFC